MLRRSLISSRFPFLIKQVFKTGSFLVHVSILRLPKGLQKGVNKGPQKDPKKVPKKRSKIDLEKVHVEVKNVDFWYEMLLRVPVVLIGCFLGSFSQTSFWLQPGYEF